MNTISRHEAVRRLRADHDLLFAEVSGRAEAELSAAFRTTAGPLGDFCDSLHDLLAHVLMWDEINLAVLTEAARGRAHWSLETRWEAPRAGMALNRAGVAAGRSLSAELLLHRLRSVCGAIAGQIEGCSDLDWSGRRARGSAGGFGALAQRVWTVPGQPAFWHAALHLNRLPEVWPASPAAGGLCHEGEPGR